MSEEAERRPRYFAKKIDGNWVATDGIHCMSREEKMSGVTCGGCGQPLRGINSVCDSCLPNFYMNPQPYPDGPRGRSMKRLLQFRWAVIGGNPPVLQQAWEDIDDGGVEWKDLETVEIEG